MRSESLRILVVDDDRALRTILATLLEGEGYIVDAAKSGVEALDLFSAQLYDLVILDVMMPGFDGFQTCELIRGMDENVPVLFLSAKGDIVDKRVGYASGADDYVAKPFSSDELLLRIKGLLRMRVSRGSRESDQAILRCGNLKIDIVRQKVWLNETLVSLTPIELRIVLVLARYPQQPISQQQIISEVWGDEYLGEAISVPAYIRRIREKVEENPSSPSYIQTVWGRGYRLNLSE